MDIKMQSETIESGKLPVWDFYISDDGKASMIFDEEEDLQEAQIAAYLTKGSTPQLRADEYVDWLGFFLGQITFGELDAQIKQSIQNAGQTDYYPQYEIENEKLKVVITKEI
jgi:hypothetical protein